MKILICIARFLKAIFIEAFIIFIYIFLINNYIGHVDVYINNDAIGYYDYLPSLFIRHDLIRKDIPDKNNPALYRHIDNIWGYINYHDYKVDKYACGTAVLQLPFFAYAYTTTTLNGGTNDGYQRPFQVAVFYATIFYLFLALFFLKKTLELYDIKKYVVILSQLLLVLATSVTHYANAEAGFSHVYSLFAITAFIYFMGSYFKKKNINHFIIACLFLGLILILRQLNILIILFVPFLAGSWQNLIKGINGLWVNYKKTLIGVFLIFLIFFIQCTLWYLQTGHFLLYSYRGEGFHLLNPHLIPILFSYRKGLFVYTPVTFISISGLIWLVYKRRYYWALTWLAFFIILTYVLSSWESWYYGGSYGLRAYIDYYAVFFILYAIMLDGLGRAWQLTVIMLSLMTVPLDVIQTYQYKEGILHWADMDRVKYWKVFLKTDKRFACVVWDKKKDFDDCNLLKDISIGDIDTYKGTCHEVFAVNSHDVPDFDKVSIIQMLIDSDYERRNDSKVELSIDESGDHHNYYRREIYLIRFSEKDFNEWQTGYYNYEFTPVNDTKDMIVTLQIFSGSRDNHLKNVRIRFWSRK